MRFHEIFADEVRAIATRRARITEQGRTNRPAIALEDEDVARDGTPIKRPTSASEVVGLALSGGGIRSSAFCLGVLQALDYHNVIDRIDYLSTVSGGGYIGTSMTAAMSDGCNGEFPFRSELRSGEVPAVQHIRDHSNYLFPQGFLNIFGNVAVYLRGLAANVILILPWLLLAAALTIHSNPTVEALRQTNIVGYRIRPPIPVTPLGVTANLSALFLFGLAIWALWRSVAAGQSSSDVGGAARIFGVFLLAVIGVAFIEAQPWILGIIFNISDLGGLAVLLAEASTWLKTIAGVLASLATLIGFLGRFLADYLRRAEEKPGIAAFTARIAIKLAMYVAGAAVPIALWAVYLYLSFWGIQDCSSSPCSAQTPRWLTAVISIVHFDVAQAYYAAALVLIILGLLLKPNSNSLHRLYRDRLSKAFLFDPTRRQEKSLLNPRGRVGPEADPTLHNSDLRPLEQLKLSALRPDLTPYHLINAALNIEASRYANRRGRNADFFIFSPRFIGSEATGYADTEAVERREADLTVSTAMAVSGAAASSNMGSVTIKPLTPTLAILNVRLGYWLMNPAKVAGSLARSLLHAFDYLYFLKELLGRLSESGGFVYLTDGGHIENLGVYELLRRRCKLIIAVDAEADPDMTFGSLVTLERYARIDQSIRIDLPWAELRDATRKASEEIARTGGVTPASAPHGPHCALGTIYYPRKPQNGPGHESESESTGVLLYIKSSLTGDENDYIVDYKRRNPTFPHETTADQFFTEEQFEVYRALGFHAVNSALKGADRIATSSAPPPPQGPITTSPQEKRLRDILGL